MSEIVERKLLQYGAGKITDVLPQSEQKSHIKYHHMVHRIPLLRSYSEGWQSTTTIPTDLDNVPRCLDSAEYGSIVVKHFLVFSLS